MAEKKAASLGNTAAAEEDTAAQENPAAAKEDIAAQKNPAAATEDAAAHKNPAAATEDTAAQKNPAAAKEDTAAQKNPAAATEDTAAQENSAAAKEDTAAQENPAAAEEDTAAQKNPAAAKEDAAAHKNPAAATEDTAAQENSAAAKEDTAAQENPAAAEEDTAAQKNPAAAKEDAAAQENPAAAKDDTAAHKNPVAATEDAAAQENPAAAKDDTAAHKNPAAAKEDAAAQENPAAAEEDTAAQENPAAAEEDAAAQENAASTAGTERLKGLVVCAPDSASAMLSEIDDPSVLGSAFYNQLTVAADQFFSKNYAECIQSCDVLLDKARETLNTGSWRDVDISWRKTYSVVCYMKAFSQHCVYADSQGDTNRYSALETCDMGLLMGAPLTHKLLVKLAQGIEADLKRESRAKLGCNTGTENSPGASPRKRARTSSGDADGALSKPQPGTSSEREDSKSPDPVDQDRAMARCNCPSVQMFQAMFHDLEMPVVITDAIGFWPAFTVRKWSLEYLRSVAGARTVPVEIGSRYTDEDWTQKLMTVNEFIDDFITSPKSDTKGYLAQHNLFDQIVELKDDISVPVYCCLAEEEDVDINAWFGPSGTVSPLHHDLKHNFLCQVMGEKYVRLYPPKFTPNLYPHPSKLLHNTSQVDCESPDLDKFPLFADATFIECVLKPGEMLYIPPKHWHFVKARSVSFSVSFWWQ